MTGVLPFETFLACGAKVLWASCDLQFKPPPADDLLIDGTLFVCTDFFFSGEEHSTILGMFMATTLNAATFMGKNFSTIQSVVKNYEDLTLKQMFDVTAQLVNDQEEIYGLDKIQWERDSWKRLSLIGDETVINLQSTKVYVFSDSVLFLGKVLQHPESNEAWKNRIAGDKSVRSYRDYDGINGESTEFEWNIFLGFTNVAAL